MTNNTNFSSQQLEGSPWFWKLFGGALIGLTTLLLAVILNTMMNSQMVFRSETQAVITYMKEESVQMREKLAIINQARDFGKERYNELDRLVKVNDDLLKLHKEKIALLEAGLKERQIYSEENAKSAKSVLEKMEKENNNLKKEVSDLKERFLLLETKIGKN